VRAAYLVSSFTHNSFLACDFRLKTWTRQEGAVRLSEDDGPPSHLFLGDDYDVPEEGEERYNDGAANIGRGDTSSVPPIALQRVGTMGEDEIPTPPPKD
jgi:hypothetical protein